METQLIPMDSLQCAHIRSSFFSISSSPLPFYVSITMPRNGDPRIIYSSFLLQTIKLWTVTEISISACLFLDVTNKLLDL